MAWFHSVSLHQDPANMHVSSLSHWHGLVGSLNRVTINVISYTCAFPIMRCHSFCWGRGPQCSDLVVFRPCCSHIFASKAETVTHYRSLKLPICTLNVWDFHLLLCIVYAWTSQLLSNQHWLINWSFCMLLIASCYFLCGTKQSIMKCLRCLCRRSGAFNFSCANQGFLILPGAHIFTFLIN